MCTNTISYWKSVKTYYYLKMYLYLSRSTRRKFKILIYKKELKKNSIFSVIRMELNRNFRRKSQLISKLNFNLSNNYHYISIPDNFPFY